MESFRLTHLVNVASGQRQRSCSRPLLGPEEPKCSEEEHRQPEEEEGINAWLSLIAFLRASLDAQIFSIPPFILRVCEAGKPFADRYAEHGCV